MHTDPPPLGILAEDIKASLQSREVGLPERIPCEIRTDTKDSPVKLIIPQYTEVLQVQFKEKGIRA